MYSTDIYIYIYEACERKRTVIVNQTKNKKRLWSLSEENKIIVLAEMMSSEIRKNMPENLPIEEKSRLIIFMVKKYKCIIIWLFSVASIAEFIYLILEKNSEGKFLEIAQKYLNATRANLSDFF